MKLKELDAKLLRFEKQLKGLIGECPNLVIRKRLNVLYNDIYNARKDVHEINPQLAEPLE